MAVACTEHGQRLPGRPLVAVRQRVVSSDAYDQHGRFAHKLGVELGVPEAGVECVKSRVQQSSESLGDCECLSQGEIPHSARRSRISLSRSVRRRRVPMKSPSSLTLSISACSASSMRALTLMPRPVWDHAQRDATYLRATTESGAVWDDPSEDLLFELLSDVEQGTELFLVIHRLGATDTYIQVLLQDDRTYLVEHRDGGPSSHFAATSSDKRTVHEVLTRWAYQLPGWKSPLGWASVTF